VFPPAQKMSYFLAHFLAQHMCIFCFYKIYKGESWYSYFSRYNMAEQLARITVKDANFSGPVDGQIVITGIIVKFEPEALATREILRPVEPDEPDTNVEVGYSRNTLEPLTVVYRNRKVTLTKTPYIMFRYVNDLYRTEGRTEFEFAELSEAVTGDEFTKGDAALEHTIRRLSTYLARIIPPFSLTYRKEILYICAKKCAKK
jgi:hypothetical protein